MKTITNKTTKIIDGSKTPAVAFTHAELLKVVINFPPQAGFSVSEMRDRLRIWGFLDTATMENKDILLEDADFNTLKAKFDEFKWTQVHEDIVALADHLDSLTK